MSEVEWSGVKYARMSRDIRTVGCDSHGTLQVDEVRAAGRDDKGGIVEFAIKGLNVPQSVGRARAESANRLEILVNFFFRNPSYLVSKLICFQPHQLIKCIWLVICYNC